jgi:phospholipid transport system substrate-binding protein
MKRTIILVLIAMVLGIAGVQAEDTTAVESLLKEKVDAALTILRQPDQDLATKKKAIVTIIEPLFDFPLMAKLVLGKTHWLSLTPTEQKRFETLFVERLKSSYIDKIDLYSDEQIAWKPALDEGGNKVRIPAVIVSKDKEITILYKLHHFSEQWKIYDVEVQGVSIVTSFRSQFNQILTTGTKADLFKELETPARPSDPGKAGSSSAS